ncbi:MAG: histone deacetylase family protein, partial [Verrucomicrobiales bacterium]
ASRDQSMGFCVFNNVAVGVAHALEHHGLERVAVIDFDAHHGNGTEDIFKDDPRVMLCSSFQQRIYPESIPGPGNDYMIFAPLLPRSGSGVFRDAVTRLFLPALNRFRPQIVFVSAGFDSHRADEMADLDLIDEDYAWITRELKQVSAVHSGRRLVSTLEGGYELQALGRSVAAHLKVLCDI